MQKAKKYVYRNWFWIVLGIVLTRFAVENAYLERGYLAYGGEWLVIPNLLLVVKLVKDAMKGMGEKRGD